VGYGRNPDEKMSGKGTFLSFGKARQNLGRIPDVHELPGNAPNSEFCAGCGQKFTRGKRNKPDKDRTLVLTWVAARD
jgi:hypothetical protein